MTGTAEASNPQVRTQIRASSQVAKSAPRTLSRWRHGFEPRWDYQQSRRSGRICVRARLARPPDVPQPCRNVQSAREFAIRAIALLTPRTSWTRKDLRGRPTLKVGPAVALAVNQGNRPGGKSCCRERRG